MTGRTVGEFDQRHLRTVELKLAVAELTKHDPEPVPIGGITMEWVEELRAWRERNQEIIDRALSFLDSNSYITNGPTAGGSQTSR